MLLILSVVIIFFCICLLLYANGKFSFATTSKQITESDSDVEPVPTMHIFCSNNQLCNGINCVNECGGNLGCDHVSSRCKQKNGGSCSSDNDCLTGLVCSNWICIPSDNISDSSSLSPALSNKKDKKKVTWDSNNDIFHIPSRKR